MACRDLSNTRQQKVTWKLGLEESEKYKSISFSEKVIEIFDLLFSAFLVI